MDVRQRADYAVTRSSTADGVGTAGRLVGGGGFVGGGFVGGGLVGGGFVGGGFVGGGLVGGTEVLVGAGVFVGCPGVLVGAGVEVDPGVLDGAGVSVTIGVLVTGGMVGGMTVGVAVGGTDVGEEPMVGIGVDVRVGQTGGGSVTIGSVGGTRMTCPAAIKDDARQLARINTYSEALYRLAIELNVSPGRTTYAFQKSGGLHGTGVGGGAEDGA